VRVSDKLIAILFREDFGGAYMHHGSSFFRACRHIHPKAIIEFPIHNSQIDIRLGVLAHLTNYIQMGDENGGEKGYKDCRCS